MLYGSLTAAAPRRMATFVLQKPISIVVTILGCRAEPLHDAAFAGAQRGPRMDEFPNNYKQIERLKR